MADTFRQEMPPKEGFGSIIYERIPLKKPMSGWKMFTIWAIWTVGCFSVYCNNQIYLKYVKREEDEVTVALEPLLIAERDRIYLNQLRQNREDEKELMKDVPGWKVGTLYGMPLYKTVSEGRFVHPIREEYYAHAHPWALPYQHLFDAKF